MAGESMDAYSIHGDQYYQGYPVQAPPPGTAPNQALPPGAAPTQPSVPVSTPLAPPGVAPPPSSAASSYYGSYAPPPHGYDPSSAERWSSYPVPAADPRPYAFHPPPVPYDRPGYGHHPYHQQQQPFRHAYSFPRPPQPHMPFPPRGSDVTRFRKKRPFLPHQNLRPKNRPFKQPQENYRSGGKNFQQVKKAFDSDTRAFSATSNGIPVANNAQTLHPFWHGRLPGVPANNVGKKRRMDDRGEGRPSRSDNRRKGDKRARPGWNKGKRKKGRKQGGDESNLDPSSEAKVTSPPVKIVDVVPVAEVQAQQETPNWSEVHRDVRRRVQEFLHTSEREALQKREIQDMQELTLKGAGGGVNAAMQVDTQEPAKSAVGGDANAGKEDSQEGRQALGGVAKAETQGTQVDVGGNANAETGDTQEAALGDQNAKMQGTEEALEEAMLADANAQVHLAKNDAVAQLDYIDAQQADNAASSQANHMDALLSNGTQQQQLDYMHGVQSYSADLPLARANIDVVQPEESHADEVNAKKLDIVDILKADCENAPLLATEIVQDLVVKDVQECPGVDEANREQNNQQPLLDTAHDFVTKHEKHPEASGQDEAKELEEKTFNFFIKLFKEDRDLRNLYIENCDNGAFECLMCHSKIKKRFSNLVSLVTHANNVLKTKKLVEHRGYGRAVCALLGWDPLKYPKASKAQACYFEVEKLPADDVRAPLGVGDVCAPVRIVVEHVLAADATEDGPQVHDAVKGVAVFNAADSKLMADVEESALGGKAGKGVHTADAMEGEPAGGADQTEPRGEIDESVPPCDADKCAPLRDTGSPVEQVLMRDMENDIVCRGGMGSKEELIAEDSGDAAEQALVSMDIIVERENEAGGNMEQVVGVAESISTGHVPEEPLQTETIQVSEV